MRPHHASGVGRSPAQEPGRIILQARPEVGHKIRPSMEVPVNGITRVPSCPASAPGRMAPAAGADEREAA